MTTPEPPLLTNTGTACTVCGTFGCEFEDHRWHRSMALFEQQITQTYVEYREPLVRFGHWCAKRSHVSDVDVDIEGVVHDAFLATVPHWDGIEEPHAYLFAVVRRLIARGVRSSSRRWVHELGHAHHELRVWWASTVSTPAAEQAAACRRVFEVLADLPQRQRVATYLHHVAGFSHVEIADLLDCAPATVGVHIHRGVQTLRDDPHVVAGIPMRDAFASKPSVVGLLPVRVWAAVSQFVRSMMATVSRAVSGLFRSVKMKANSCRSVASPQIVDDLRARLAGRKRLAKVRQLLWVAFTIVTIQANILARRWFTGALPVPPCETCGVGWMDLVGEFRCWCCRYHSRAGLSPQLRLRRRIRKARTWCRAHNHSRLLASPRQRADGQVGDIVEAFREDLTDATAGRQLVRTSVAAVRVLGMLGPAIVGSRRGRNIDPELNVPCQKCNVVFRRDDGGLGCWCGENRFTPVRKGLFNRR